MKILLYLICACLFACQEALALSKSDLYESEIYCLEKFHVDTSVLINSFYENGLMKEGNPLTDKIILCAWMEDGLRDENGYLMVHNLIDYVKGRVKQLYPTQDSHRLAVESVNACKKITGTDFGDASIKIYNCISWKISELVFD